MATLQLFQWETKDRLAGQLFSWTNMTNTLGTTSRQRLQTGWVLNPTAR